MRTPEPTDNFLGLVLELAVEWFTHSDRAAVRQVQRAIESMMTVVDLSTPPRTNADGGDIPAAVYPYVAGLLRLYASESAHDSVSFSRALTRALGQTHEQYMTCPETVMAAWKQAVKLGRMPFARVLAERWLRTGPSAEMLESARCSGLLDHDRRSGRTADPDQ